MESKLATTPFGRRPLSLAMVSTQVAAKAAPPDAVVHKWQIYRAICEAKAALGVTDRALAVLNALLTFHPETVLTVPRRAAGDEAAENAPGLIVFPSNDQLALRAHGMAPATLRRHLAVLVDCGLLIRRDSPNGKRYARKGQGGVIETAFGFDLTPLVARAAEFERLAEAARAERRAYLVVREGITLVRRDIAKMIAAGTEEGVAGDWRGFQEAYLALARRIPRTATKTELEPLLDELGRLAEQIRKVLETHVNSQNKSANESHSERHIQNSNTKLHESEPAPQQSRGAAVPKSDAPSVRHGPAANSGSRLRRRSAVFHWEWSSKRAQTLSITLGTGFPPGVISLRRRVLSGRCSGSAQAHGRRPPRCSGTRTPPLWWRQFCSEERRSKAQAVICET